MCVFLCSDECVLYRVHGDVVVYLGGLNDSRGVLSCRQNVLHVWWAVVGI